MEADEAALNGRDGRDEHARLHDIHDGEAEDKDVGVLWGVFGVLVWLSVGRPGEVFWGGLGVGHHQHVQDAKLTSNASSVSSSTFVSKLCTRKSVKEMSPSCVCWVLGVCGFKCFD